MADKVNVGLKSTQPQSAIPRVGSENMEGIEHDVSRENVDPSLANPQPIFSSQKTAMDELTSRGMEIRTGVIKEYLPHFGTRDHRQQYRFARNTPQTI
jgi:hypothetical protein